MTPTVEPEVKTRVVEILQPEPVPIETARIPETKEHFGTGWRPDPPDLRDYTIDHPEITALLKRTKIIDFAKSGAPLPRAITSVDLRQYCSPIDNQLNIGSCTAHAADGIVEYYENRAFGRFIDGSRLFVYKTERELLGWTGDTGGYLRTTMGALALFGFPPERYWPYDVTKFDVEPPAFVYALASDYKGLKYFRHDPVGKVPSVVLSEVKAFLAAGLPSMFGFYGFPSWNSADVKGAFPYPGPNEKAIWGHAVATMGFDDNLRIKNLVSGRVTTGALLIRNSWGGSWGNAGYGWLPYDYVLNKYATDFWTLLQLSWIDSGAFNLPF